MLPALAKYPYARATFCVQTNRIDAVGGVTTQTITDLFNRGHEIASHSVSHPHVPGLTVAQREAEYDNSKTALEAIVGTGNVRTWAYPYNERSGATDQELYLRYDRVFGGAAPHRWVQGSDGRFCYHRLQWQSTNHEGVLAAVRRLVREPVVLSLYLHDPGNSSGGFASDPSAAQVEELIALAHELDVPMLTAAQALPGAPALITNPGFDSDLAGWQFVNDAEVGNSATVVASDLNDGTYSPNMLELVQGAGLVMQCKQFVPVEPGRDYEFSFRYKVAAGGLYHAVFEYADDGTQLNSLISASLTSGAWTRTQRPWTTNTATSYVEVRWYLDASSTAYVAHAWFGPKSAGQLG